MIWDGFSAFGNTQLAILIEFENWDLYLDKLENSLLSYSTVSHGNS